MLESHRRTGGCGANMYSTYQMNLLRPTSQTSSGKQVAVQRGEVVDLIRGTLISALNRLCLQDAGLLVGQRRLKLCEHPGEHCSTLSTPLVWALGIAE
jgi:hypothetical protein